MKNIIQNIKKIEELIGIENWEFLKNEIWKQEKRIKELRKSREKWKLKYFQLRKEQNKK